MNGKIYFGSFVLSLLIAGFVLHGVIDSLPLYAGVVIAVALLVSIGCGQFFKIMYTHRFYRSHFQHSEDIQNYKAFLAAQKKYDQWFTRTQFKFWMGLKGFDFNREVVNLLRRLGYKVRRIESQDRIGYVVVMGSDTLIMCEELSGAPLSHNELLKRYKHLQFTDYKKAIIINRKGFTRECYRSARMKPIELWDINRLIELQKKLET